MIKALSEFHSLFFRDSPVNSSLYFFNRSFTATVDERRYIKFFPGVLQNLFCNRTRRLTKYIRKDIIQFKIGYSKTILGTIFLAGDHTGEFETVSYEIPELSDVSRWNKRRFNHAAHV